MVDKLRARDSWAGQTHVQKSLFVASAPLDIDLGLNYQLHHYGPFSRVLEQRIHHLADQSVLAFVPQEPPWGPRLATSEGAEIIRETHPTSSLATTITSTSSPRR